MTLNTVEDPLFNKQVKWATNFAELFGNLSQPKDGCIDSAQQTEPYGLETCAKNLKHLVSSRLIRGRLTEENLEAGATT
jgi:hypothetical protein